MIGEFKLGAAARPAKDLPLARVTSRHPGDRRAGHGPELRGDTTVTPRSR